MKTKIPYNAGEIRTVNSKPALIAGHIWWPVEQVNAYQCVFLDKDGNPGNKAEYIWDHSHGGWPLVESA